VTHLWLVRNRPLLRRLGVEHRETLVVEYMTRHHLTRRPLLKNIWHELIEDIQDVPIVDEPLPMDRFAQTELVNGRPRITINTLIGRMPKVKNPERIRPVSGWHESIHIPVDVERRDIPPLTELTSGLGADTSSPLLCQAITRDPQQWSLREQAIEAAALAAAIADADLKVGSAYLNFLEYTSWGGDPDGVGWHLLCQVSASIGVNVTALARFFEQHGLCRRVMRAGRFHLHGVKRPFRGFVCLEPESASLRSIT
jgi:hypothetical protein